MKKAIFSLVGAALAISAFAQASKPAAPPAKLHCAVMTASFVNVATATKTKMFADYKGRRYFFCCDGCPDAFKANPAKYAKNDSIPAPKKPKAKSKPAKAKAKPMIKKPGGHA